MKMQQIGEKTVLRRFLLIEFDKCQKAVISLTISAFDLTVHQITDLNFLNLNFNKMDQR